MRWEDTSAPGSGQCAPGTVFVQANGQLLLRLSCGHPQRVARRQAVGERTSKRFKTDAAKQRGKRAGCEGIAVCRNVISAPVHASDRAVSTRVVGSLEVDDAAQLKNPLRAPEACDRLPFVVDVAELGHHVTGILRQ